jgi:hypothetical protein
VRPVPSAVFEWPDQLEQWLPFLLKGVPLPLTSSHLFRNRRGSLAVDLGTATRSSSLRAVSLGRLNGTAGKRVSSLEEPGREE